MIRSLSTIKREAQRENERTRRSANNFPFLQDASIYAKPARNIN
jgi:hypothetical protein